MGYPDNEIIAGQVELGDRIPEPKPAYRHVAYPTRKAAKQGRELARARVKKIEREILWGTLSTLVVGGVAGLVIGVLLGVML